MRLVALPFRLIWMVFLTILVILGWILWIALLVAIGSSVLGAPGALLGFILGLITYWTKV